MKKENKMEKIIEQIKANIRYHSKKADDHGSVKDYASALMHKTKAAALEELLSQIVISNIETKVH